MHLPIYLTSYDTTNCKKTVRNGNESYLKTIYIERIPHFLFKCFVQSRTYKLSERFIQAKSIYERFTQAKSIYLNVFNYVPY